MIFPEVLPSLRIGDAERSTLVWGSSFDAATSASKFATIDGWMFSWPALNSSDFGDICDIE